MTPSKKHLLIVLLIVSFFAIACRNIGQGYVGVTVKEERLLALDEGGPHSGRLETKDLVLEYLYNKVQNNLTISGTITFSDPSVTGFRMKFHFTDAQGVIIEDQVVYLGRMDRLKPNPFQQNYTLPANTRFMAVSYEGRLGTRDNNPMSFWRNP